MPYLYGHMKHMTGKRIYLTEFAEIGEEVVLWQRCENMF
jgi:hypothetical protein